MGERTGFHHTEETKQKLSEMRRGDNRGRVPCYTWEVGAARNVFRLVSALRPRLIIKDEAADLMLQSLRERYGERLED